MRVTIFGSGYVGLVTGACLAETGNHVLCVDVDAGKIETLNAGKAMSIGAVLNRVDFDRNRYYYSRYYGYHYQNYYGSAGKKTA